MWWVPLLGELIKRLFPDPQQRMDMEKLLQEAQAKAAEEEARKDEAFAEFIKATTPESQYVYAIVNSLIALVRPGLAVFMAVSLIFWTPQLVASLKALAEAGVWGALALTPLWAWTLGRDGVRLVLALMGRGDLVKQPGVPLSPIAKAPKITDLLRRVKNNANQRERPQDSKEP